MCARWCSRIRHTAANVQIWQSPAFLRFIFNWAESNSEYVIVKDKLVTCQIEKNKYCGGKLTKVRGMESWPPLARGPWRRLGVLDSSCGASWCKQTGLTQLPASMHLMKQPATDQVYFLSHNLLLIPLPPPRKRKAVRAPFWMPCNTLNLVLGM